MKTPLLINAAEMARRHPETFGVPSDKDIEHVQAGSLVKVCDGRERFWVVVTSIDESILTGTVNSLLVASKLTFGKSIKFHVDNIFEIYQESGPRIAT